MLVFSYASSEITISQMSEAEPEMGFTIAAFLMPAHRLLGTRASSTKRNGFLANED